MLNTSNQAKQLYKRLSYLLSTVNISFELLSELSWKQIYKLLRKASKINSKFSTDKKELKQLAKDFVLYSKEQVVTENIAGIFKETIAVVFETVKETYLNLFVYPFINLFWSKRQIIRC